MPRIRLLHASDFHLAQTPYWAGTSSNYWLARLTRWWKQTSHDPLVLAAFVRWVWQNWQDPNGHRLFDALLLTGDLATTGAPADLQAARAFVDANAVGGTYLTPAGQPTLDFFNPHRPLDLLPGNHDRYHSGLSLYLPGGRVFDQVFCPPAPQRRFWCAGQDFTFAGSLTRGGLAVLIWKVDFSLPSNQRGKKHYGLPGWLGQGRVRKCILYGPGGTPANPTFPSLVGQTRAESQKVTEQRQAAVVIWALHFDPFSTDGLLQLLDSHLLEEAAAQAGVSAVLCGHTHESKVKPLSATTTVFACGATAAANEARNDFQVLEIDLPEDDRAPRPLSVCPGIAMTRLLLAPAASGS